MSMQYLYSLWLQIFISVPNPPVCSDVKENVTVSSRTSGNITLNFTRLLNNSKDHICVQQQEEHGHKNCKQIENTVQFQNLDPSTPYIFSVYSYISDSVGGMLHSKTGCPFMGYTCEL